MSLISTPRNTIQAAAPQTDARLTEVQQPAAESPLVMQDVIKQFAPSTTALDSVSFSVEESSFTVLLGLSGSGKSTLLRLVNGLHMPTSGTVKVLGQDISATRGRKLRALRRDIGMVFQQFHLVGSMTALENVCSGALGALNGPRVGLFTYPKKLREAALEQLERVGLADQRFQRADTLSGGQQQRVAVARALVQRPKILLADEPVASLDPESSHQIMTLINQIAKEDRLTVLCTLHQVNLAMEWGDRILGLRQGELVLDESTDTLSTEEAMGIYQSVSGRPVV
ncbi:phosphonate ABC transporter ATP-binding protein [Enteractinococcus fodinae]|uniref:Phosphonate transport system ATP-binding protein n=1 Tax=Enteractinococcus fodinae TaxID=684663 RepID=A0ABU2B1I0_9MICC|nr:phosphonate ABC transporter ATP-binding protein [Enteractinococcus fodinae]MDR7346608.1 phosphonate transport system ATP-binding protein [Enteractinococcus fodinae]